MRCAVWRPDMQTGTYFRCSEGVSWETARTSQHAAAHGAVCDPVMGDDGRLYVPEDAAGLLSAAEKAEWQANRVWDKP